MDNKKYCVLSLSGGLDSSTLLLHLINKNYEVCAVSFDYGQKHKVELEKAKELVEYINETFKDNPFFIKIKHQVITLDGLSNLLVSGLVDNDSMELKKGHYAHENALTTVVPNRNAIFASITYAIALSIVKKTGEKCDIALGTHMGDFDNLRQDGIYPDCSEEFRVALEHAFKIGNWDSEKVDYYAPFNSTNKTGVLREGFELCKLLDLDYKEIYSRTNTSYNPILINNTNTYYSDYKTGASIERIMSFFMLGAEDPLQYVEDDGTLVPWEYVKNYALQIEDEFKMGKFLGEQAVLIKVSDDMFDGSHPNGVDEGYTVFGTVLTLPKIDERFEFGYFRNGISTSPVTEISLFNEEEIIFKTLNSTYKLIINKQQNGRI